MSNLTIDVLFTEKNQLGVITLNRPQALNALSLEMLQAIHQQLVDWASTPHIKAVIITSVPGKAFCAGGDIRQLYKMRQQSNSPGQQYFWHEYRLTQYLYHYPKPYIALLNGITMGGGVGVSIHGSHRVATENFLFAMPETSIGFFPDIGASFFLSRCANQTGVYLGLTGARITAGDALDLKLIDTYVSSHKLPDLIEALSTADFTADTPRDVVSSIIKSFHDVPEAPALKLYHPHIDTCFSHQSIERILQELETHRLEWCHTTAALLKTKSPTSLKITLQALRYGAMQDFDQCIQMEYRLAVRFLQRHDFYEGVRAIIIDKDQKPAWQPAINDSDVEAYFAPLKDVPELTFS